MARSGSIVGEKGRDADAAFARQSERRSESAEREREDIREDARVGDAARREQMTPAGADRRAEVPRTRTDAANPNMDREFPSPSATRQRLSSNMKKSLNRHKRTVQEEMPSTRYEAMNRAIGNRQVLGRLNQRLHDTVGMRSDLRPAERRRVNEIDNSIRDFEVGNERQHIVYSTLTSPKAHGNSRNALRATLRNMASREDPEPGSTLSQTPSSQTTMTFDGYIPATHTLGEVPESDDIVMEIRTRSGMYLGTSDTRHEADHLVGRGRVLRPRGVREVSYVRRDGSQGRRWIVQMDDVTEATSEPSGSED